MSTRPEADDEDRLAASRDLDLLPTAQVVRMIQEQDATVPAATAAAADELVRAVDAVAERLARGGRMFYAGAGTSGRLAMLDAAEIPPTYGVPPERVQVIMAGGEGAFLAAAEGAEDDAGAARREVARRVRAADALVGIAASGTTPFTVAAVEAARDLGALTVAVTSGLGSPLAAAAEIAVVAETGPEVVMGSSRMKAGTAQKLLLNALSTAVMVRLGHVYGDLMVEMPPTNRKLGARARRMVELAARVDAEEAQAALEAAGGRVSVAVLICRLGLPPGAAAARLEEAGSLRRALGE